MITFVMVLGGIGSINIINLNYINVSLFDILAVTITILFITSYKFKVQLLNPSKDLQFFTYLYFYTSSLMPIFGIILMSHSLGQLGTSLNWLLFLVLIIISYNIYINKEFQFYEDLARIFKISLIIHFIFLVNQILVSHGVLDSSLILDVRFNESSLKYGHIGRFNGAMSNISSLGLFGLLSSCLFIWRGKWNKKYEWIWLLSSIILLFSSGHRTSLLLFILYVIFISPSAIRKSDLLKYFKNFSLFLLGFSIVLYLTYYFNLGRVQTSNRYSEMLGIFTGEVSFNETSGRLIRWDMGIDYILENGSLLYGILGSLGYTEITVDSMFISLIAQGGIILLLIFFILISMLFLKLIYYYNRNESLFGFSILCLFSLLVFGINQSLLNSNLGKFFLLVPIVALLISNKTKINSS